MAGPGRRGESRRGTEGQGVLGGSVPGVTRPTGPRAKPAPLRRALRWFARSCILILLISSLITGGWAVARIAEDPLVRPFVERSAAEFAAALEREMAQEATPQVVSARLAALLAEDPRNWIAIEALEEVAAARGIAIAPLVALIRIDAWAEDSGYLSIAGACLSCTVNAASCSLSQALICNAPVALTPVGDVIGLGKAGVAAWTGAEVDRLDLALSAIGLGATVATVATGGTSYTLKAGASLLRLARKMSLLPPRLTTLITDAATRGVDWTRALSWDGVTDPARLLRADVIRPVAEVATDLGRMSDTLGPTRTLHLLRFVDGPDDARRIANAAETLGPRTLGTLEILGKSRFLRAAVRWSDEAAALMAGFVGLILTLGTALTSAVQSLMLRGLRRGLAKASR